MVPVMASFADRRFDLHFIMVYKLSLEHKTIL